MPTIAFQILPQSGNFKIFSVKNIILYLPYVLLARFFAVVRDLMALNSIVQVLLINTLHQDISGNDPRVNTVAEVLHRKIKAMPVVLQTAMTILTHVFNWYGLALAGRLFCCQSLKQRQRQIAQWRNSPLGLCRDFIGFYEKMTVFIYFSLCPQNI